MNSVVLHDAGVRSIAERNVMIIKTTVRDDHNGRWRGNRQESAEDLMKRDFKKDLLNLA